MIKHSNLFAPFSILSLTHFPLRDTALWDLNEEVLECFARLHSLVPLINWILEDMSQFDLLENPGMIRSVPMSIIVNGFNNIINVGVSCKGAYYVVNTLGQLWCGQYLW